MNRRNQWSWVVGAGLANVVAGHTIVYALISSRANRAGVLAGTGHSYWDAAIFASAFFGTAALAVLVARSFRRGLYGRARALPGYLNLATRLACIQVVTFTAMEVLERVAAGLPVPIPEQGVLPIGVLVQVLVALVAAGLLRWLARGAEALGIALRPAPHPTAPGVVVSSRSEFFAPGRICGAHRGRGPPLTFS